jgi:DNA-binding transcriptional MerR regulator
MNSLSSRDQSDSPEVFSLRRVAAILGVHRHQLAEWVRLGLLPAPASLGRRRNGRTVAYAFSEADLVELRRLVEPLKKGTVAG